jgi:deoxyribonuclease V
LLSNPKLETQNSKQEKMIIAIDVHYRETEAKIVAVAYENWTDSVPNQTYIAFKKDIEDYEPGAFFKRELPCIIEIMTQMDVSTVDFIVVDGYVFLNDEGKKGLGYYVYEHFNEKIPVIGVAKTRFFENDKWVRPILRGSSQNPLYVTSIGVDLDEAASFIATMNGDFRMPTLLKLLDTITKE